MSSETLCAITPSETPGAKTSSETKESITFSQNEYDTLVTLMNMYLIYYRKTNNIQKNINWFDSDHAKLLNAGFKSAKEEYEKGKRWVGEFDNKPPTENWKLYNLVINKSILQSSTTLFGLFFYMNKNYKWAAKVNDWTIVSS
jgi:hypothetical protein